MASRFRIRWSAFRSRLRSRGMNPIPIPSIWCDPEGFPESTADSVGPTAATYS